MMREMLQAKLHRGIITEVRFDYEGSLTIDPDLYEQCGMAEYQKIQVLNANNGYRLETYVISGRRGSREICVNGPAARHAMKGDRVVVCAYCLIDERELPSFTPHVLVLDERNEVISSHR